MTVLAVVAHPDDIEFMMAGTLLLLRQAGAKIHMWNLANGCCGSVKYAKKKIIAIRAREGKAAAQLAEAVYHPAFFDDMGIFYDASSLARIGSLLRKIAPQIVLTHFLHDYMEDHQNTCRLVVSGMFARGMRNFKTKPAYPTYDTPVAIYHALPHGLKDGLGQSIKPSFFVDIESVLQTKRKMLACHRSQKEWLDTSQGMNAYLNEMEFLSRKVGGMSGCYRFAEGWSQHSHLGFAPLGFNPLKELLKQKYHYSTK